MAQQPTTVGQPSGSVFVIMPFNPISDLVYETLIAPLVSAAGFSVSRADTSLNQRAIMQEVIQGIRTADLVIADLTGRNANVFYELGCAHALRKPTLLLAQSTNDIPFDLSAYRAVIYSIEFEVGTRLGGTLSGQLAPLLDAIRRGEVEFSSPIADFDVQTAQVPSPEEEEEGILDLIQRVIARDQPRYVAALEQLNALTEQMTAAETEVTARLQIAPEGRELEHAIEVSSDLAKLFDEYAGQFETLTTDELQPVALAIEKGSIAAARLAKMNEDPNQLAGLLASLDEMSASSRTAAETTVRTAELLRQNAEFTSALRKPGRRLAASLEQIASQFELMAGLPEKVRARVA